MATCPETSQAMQRCDEDPHLHHLSVVTAPNLLESVELRDKNAMKTDEQTVKEYMEVNIHK